MTKDHTKCAGPSDFAIPRPISSDGQQALIDLHNQYRAAVPAANMLKTYWDPELATMSQNHCNMCGFDHDLAENRISVKYGWKNGQNMIVTTDQRSPATDLFSMMYDAEQKRFAFGVGCNDTTKAGCLHYTQAMLSNINLMGCSQTDCIYPDQVQRFCCCNYIQSQYANSYMTPYQKACPNNCDKKTMLCDCGTKVCPNGQSLDAVCNCGDPKKRQHNSNDENDSLYKRSEDILEAEEKRDQNTEEIVDPVYIYHSPTGEISGREFVNIRAEKRRKHNNIRPEKRKFNHIIPAKRNENTEEIVDPVYIYHSPTGEISGREFVNIRAEKRRKHNNIRPEKRRFNHITPAKRRFNHITPAKRRFNHITPAKRRFNHITPAKRRFNHIKPTRDELVRSIDQMVDELEQKQQRSTNLMMEQNEMEENI
ncbi:unnamed protein product [Didymodactylos carnosus]|uniref:SCP domain-containing protein n=1 Tax=Didymodactylos carnosus TaxID=1234261 RepID=A0A8S2E714_9BILA|nr:unnamed protein product [Didymodactylos carnosus]CAF3844577.1 unnamed protein product [Didymodactylos carnosus]